MKKIILYAFLNFISYELSFARAPAIDRPSGQEPDPRIIRLISSSESLGKNSEKKTTNKRRELFSHLILEMGSFRK